MDNQSRTTTYRSHPCIWALAALILLSAAPNTGIAKSMYVVADIYGNRETVPVQAYDIGPDGRLTYQTSHRIAFRGTGVVGLAVDSNSDCVFITYVGSPMIQVLNATTMTEVGFMRAPGANNLAGIVYDHDKGLLYCSDRDTQNLYCYRWDPDKNMLWNVLGSPFKLEGDKADGIALDEVHDRLYVGGITDNVLVYDTADWSLVRTIDLGRLAISVAVDPDRGYLYAGAAYALNRYLIQYDLNSGTKRMIDVDPVAGVMGLSVNALTGYIYISSGLDNRVGGDDLLVYDSSLELIQVVENIGNPTGLAIPGGHTSYNPLGLDKVVEDPTDWDATSGNRPIIPAGKEFTYSVSFHHDQYNVSDVTILDTLPQEVTFVRADGDGEFGHYDPNRHIYVWENPTLSGNGTTSLGLTAYLDTDTVPGEIFVNRVTINADGFPPTTVGAEAVAAEGTNNLLTVSKTVVTVGSDGDNDTEVIHVSAGDQVTYQICVANIDNTREFETVSVTDVLPDQTIFVGADGDGTCGAYDAVSHTYTWSYPSLAPGQSECVEIVVELRRNIPPNTTITNTAIVNSVQGSSDSTDVDVIVAYNPLGLSKAVVDENSDETAEGSITYAEPGEEVTYEISFDNLDNDLDVHNALIVDRLPEETTFVSADGHGTYGEYDLVGHTYAWTYPWLAPGATDSVKLVVRLNENVAAGTIITNTAIIDSNETPSTTTSADLTVAGDVVRFSKLVVDGAIEDPNSKGPSCVIPGTDVTYALCFENACDETLTHLAIVDTLPEEVSFVTADGDGEIGYYDLSTHMYTWFYGSLETKASACLELVVHVDEQVEPNVVITNFATLQGKEVPETLAQIDVVTCCVSDQVEAEIDVLPSRIFRTASSDSTSLRTILTLPAGIGKGIIAADIPLVLYPGEIQAHTQTAYGTSDQGKIAAYFDTNALLAATEGYGVFEIRVVGGLFTGQTFMGAGTINILKFGGP